MPAKLESSRPEEMPAELEGFSFSPLRFEDGLPVFRGILARKELVRRFGLPNAVPRPGESLFANTRRVFVNDWNDGKPIAYFELDR